MRDVPRQHVRDEAVREAMLLMEQPDHRPLLDDQDGGRHRRGRRPDPNRLTGQGSFPEKVAGAQHRDNRLFAGTGQHRELDPALLNVT